MVKKQAEMDSLHPRRAIGGRLIRPITSIISLAIKVSIYHKNIELGVDFDE
jgi:hypothetical protein